MAVINTKSTDEFNTSALKNDKLVLVDFWADWCPPCKAMAPVLDKLAEKHDDKLDVVKVDIEARDENKQLASQYGVQSIPNMLVIKAGNVVDELVGMRPQHVLEGELEKHFA